jgi:predicted NBD/HSP70 family sugar kinase
MRLAQNLVGVDLGGTKIEGGIIEAKHPEVAFAPSFETALLRPMLGDSAGVFGAALLTAGESKTSVSNTNNKLNIFLTKHYI